MTTDVVPKLVQGQNSDTLRLKKHVRTPVNQKRHGETQEIFGRCRN